MFVLISIVDEDEGPLLLIAAGRSPGDFTASWISSCGRGWVNVPANCTRGTQYLVGSDAESRYAGLSSFTVLLLISESEGVGNVESLERWAIALILGCRPDR
jgi:hypothetical protein